MNVSSTQPGAALNNACITGASSNWQNKIPAQKGPSPTHESHGGDNTSNSRGTSWFMSQMHGTESVGGVGGKVQSEGVVKNPLVNPADKLLKQYDFLIMNLLAEQNAFESPDAKRQFLARVMTPESVKHVLDRVEGFGSGDERIADVVTGLSSISFKFEKDSDFFVRLSKLALRVESASQKARILHDIGVIGNPLLKHLKDSPESVELARKLLDEVDAMESRDDYISALAIVDITSVLPEEERRSRFAQHVREIKDNPQANYDDNEKVTAISHLVTCSFPCVTQLLPIVKSISNDSCKAEAIVNLADAIKRDTEDASAWSCLADIVATIDDEYERDYAIGPLDNAIGELPNADQADARRRIAELRSPRDVMEIDSGM